MRRGRWAALGLAVALVAVAVSVGLEVRSSGNDDASPRHRASTSTSTTGSGSGSTVGAPGIGDPYFPTLGNGGYDVVHYELALDWHADAGSLAGVATIAARATQDLTRYDLDLSGLTVRFVEVDGRAATFRREERELVISPPRRVRDGETFTTVVTYDGAPAPFSEGTELFDEGWQTHGREAFVVSEPSGAETFFPSNDHPADKASVTLHVTAPDDQTVAANGLLQSKAAGAAAGTTTWTYASSAPIATYLVQVAIGDYELVDGGRAGDTVIRHALHRSYADQARVTVARTGEMLGFLESVWGPYPFEAYGVLAVDVPLGFALETQTLTLVGEDIGEAGREADTTLLHEMAHQWTGDSVSPSRWKDIWLNEGFATYSEWLWAEHEGGPTPAEAARRLPDGLDLPAGDPGREELFGPTAYERGALTLQAVREVIGAKDFFALLKAWPKEHRGKAASSADFEALAEEISGQHLHALFQRFLYDPVQPTLGPLPAQSS